MKTADQNYTPEQVIAAIEAWGRWDGVDTSRACAHLLTFTDMWRDTRAVACLHIRIVHDRHQLRNITVASVANWDRLSKLANPGSEENLVLLAREFIDGEGRPQFLPDLLSGFGHAGARRIAEAVLIATGYDEWYKVLLGGPELDAYNASQASIGLPGYETDHWVVPKTDLMAGMQDGDVRAAALGWLGSGFPIDAEKARAAAALLLAAADEANSRKAGV